MTYDEIIEALTRIAHGDATNDLESLPEILHHLASEAEWIIRKNNENNLK